MIVSAPPRARGSKTHEEEDDEDDAFALCLSLTESSPDPPNLPPARPAQDYMKMAHDYSRSLADDRALATSYYCASRRTATPHRTFPRPSAEARKAAATAAAIALGRANKSLRAAR